MLPRVLIVDDHPLVLAGLEWVLQKSGEFVVCGKAGSVSEALGLVESTWPDVVVTDLSMPGRNGLELIKDLRAIHPELPVLVVSMHDEMIYAERALRSGGRGYLMKDVPPDRVIAAIRMVLQGGVYVSDAVNLHFLQALAGGGHQPKASFPIERLTDREMEIFERIGRAEGNHEIAEALGISPRTVDAHRAHIREKLGLGDGGELTRFAIRWVESGLMAMDGPPS